MSRVVIWFLVLLNTRAVSARTFTADVMPLIKSSCIDCHDAATETRLNFQQLDYDLTKPETFRQWEKIFDRARRDEMPPKSETRPNEEQLAKALRSLETNLRETNLAAQKANGRVPARRLTRLEYEYTLHDLLGIRGELAKHLPTENRSSTFDTVAVDQGISLVHIRSYLAAADIALDEAIQLGPRPRGQPFDIDYRNSPYVHMWIDRPLRRGGSTVKMTDDAFVTFDPRPISPGQTTWDTVLNTPACIGLRRKFTRIRRERR